MMFKNVLVGVDGRPNGRDAIALAARLADPDGKLTLAHVHSGALRPSRAISPGLVREEREASGRLLEEARAGAEVSAGLISIEAMSPGKGLHVQAEDQHADLLVVGSCSHGSFGRAMLGDDTRGALNGAPCAVAIAAMGYSQRLDPIATVGVAYNQSPESEAALALAREIAAMTKARIRALEVVSLMVAYSGIVPPMDGEVIESMLKEATARMKELPGVEGRAVAGLTGEELAEFGDEVDVLIVGSRGYGPLQRLVVGSTSDYLERHARCSLLVLPRGVHAGVSASTGGESTDAVSVSASIV
jgi:nucleotide-binding universal stress UspA family protein